MCVRDHFEVLDGRHGVSGQCEENGGEVYVGASGVGVGVDLLPGVAQLLEGAVFAYRALYLPPQHLPNHNKIRLHHRLNPL